jgi:acetoin:2,6-dichlorophenolindophenol oxidoreductase subunit alpha
MSESMHELFVPMLRARRFDERLLASADSVNGPSPVGIGQEGVAAAIALVRRPGDTLSLNHRNHHHLLANGTDPEQTYREILGRDGGPQRGRAGTIHLVDPSIGVFHTSAMVGCSVGLGVGMGLAHKRRRAGAVAFALFGDGAMTEGVVAESFNLAALWQLPVIFVCESNSEPMEEQATAIVSARELRHIPEAYRIPARSADATEPRLIAEAIEAATRSARDGKGPAFVLAQTVPWPGNAHFIPAHQPPTDLDVAQGTREGWDSSDPLLNELATLLEEGTTMDTVREVDREIVETMDRAARAALGAPEADASAAMEHVLASR